MQSSAAASAIAAVTVIASLVTASALASHDPAARASNTSSGSWGDLAAFVLDEVSSEVGSSGGCASSGAHASSAHADDAHSGRVAQIECRVGLSHCEFAEHYRHVRPVMLRGLASDWPALTCWADGSHLRTRLLDEVLVLRAADGRHFLKRDCTHERRPFPSVADELFGRSASASPHASPHTSGQRFGPPADLADDSCAASPPARIYARAPLSDGLRSEVSLAAMEALVGGAAGHSFREVNCGVWLGSAGCVTPLHYDLCAQTHCPAPPQHSAPQQQPSASAPRRTPRPPPLAPTSPCAQPSLRPPSPRRPQATASWSACSGRSA